MSNTSVVWGEYEICPYRRVCRCCGAVGWAPPTMFLIYYLRELKYYGNEYVQFSDRQ